MPRRTLKEANARIKDLEQQVKKLKLLVARDPLTGLLNRRGMDEALGGISNFAILNLDLDRFRGINNTYGHQIGDEAIKFFAEILVETLRRDHDIIVRVGGDEFIVILPECDLDRAEYVKSKIKNALVAKPFVVDGLTLSLRTSIGIATAIDPKNPKVRTLETILTLADKAMYEDKEKGRASRKPK